MVLVDLSRHGATQGVAALLVEPVVDPAIDPCVTDIVGDLLELRVVPRDDRGIQGSECWHIIRERNVMARCAEDAASSPGHRSYRWRGLTGSSGNTAWG